MVKKETFGQKMARERREYEAAQFQRLRGAVKRKRQLVVFGLRSCHQDLRAAVIALGRLNTRLELVLIDDKVYIQAVEYMDA